MKSAIKGLAAAASLGVMAFATHASASIEIKLLSASMNTTYQANIVGFGGAYSNGVTFHAVDYNTVTQQNVGAAFDLFGFCVDIYHDMYLGPLGYIYHSNQDPAILNPLPTDNGGNPISPTQLTALTNLIDTGYILHQNENAGNQADTEMRLAAIQAAIWEVEVPMRNGQTTVTLSTANFGPLGTAAPAFQLYQSYFDNYVSGNYVSLADNNDRFYTITDTQGNPTHQAFAIGWPIGVPEPATWAMMLTGFFGMGSMLRANRRKLAAASI
jgi:hypothetical protein